MAATAADKRTDSHLVQLDRELDDGDERLSDHGYAAFDGSDDSAFAKCGQDR